MDYDCNHSIAMEFEEITQTVYKVCLLLADNKIAEASFTLGIIASCCTKHAEILREKYEKEQEKNESKS